MLRTQGEYPNLGAGAGDPISIVEAASTNTATAAGGGLGEGPL
jgi:hypothetical protein